MIDLISSDLRCWDADPSKRPDIHTLYNKIKELKKSYDQNENEEQTNNINSTQLNTSINTSSGTITSFVRRFSKIHDFESLPEPRNATEGKLFIKICLLHLNHCYNYYDVNLFYTYINS